MSSKISIFLIYNQFESNFKPLIINHTINISCQFVFSLAVTAERSLLCGYWKSPIFSLFYRSTSVFRFSNQISLFVEGERGNHSHIDFVGSAEEGRRCLEDNTWSNTVVPSVAERMNCCSQYYALKPEVIYLGKYFFVIPFLCNLNQYIQQIVKGHWYVDDVRICGYIIDDI
jgi:hypothetical protein